MMTFLIGSEFTQLVTAIDQLRDRMNALQAAIAALQTHVQDLSAAVTAAQASQFSTADVANLQTIDAQVQGLMSTFPTPAPTPSPTPAPEPAPAS